MIHGTKHRHEHHRAVAEERPELLIFCGVLGLLGQIVPIVTMVWADAAMDHDFVADTISDLARGPQKAIMDTGFYMAAGGLLALAIAAAHAHLGRVLWSLGIFTLAFAAMVVVMLGLWDEFGATAEGDGTSVHVRLTYGLAPLYLIGPICMMWGASGIRPVYAWLFAGAAAIWGVFGTAFQVAPDGIDGLLEKVAFAGTLLWTVPLSTLYIARGVEKRHRVI